MCFTVGQKDIIIYICHLQTEDYTVNVIKKKDAADHPYMLLVFS